MCIGPKMFHHENFFPKVHVGQVNTFRKGCVSSVDEAVC